MIRNKEKISIIALGWLGKSLYQNLMSSGNIVSGSYCNSPKGLKNEYQYDFINSAPPKEILESNIIILNLPPSKMGTIDIFCRFIDNIHEKDIIFISSTSVYGKQGKVDENTHPIPETENGKFLLECEKYIINNVKNYKIIRPAGLYGEDRHPARYLSGKEGVKGQNLPINLVSRNDLIDLIIRTMKTQKPIIINAVNVNHPQKKYFYSLVCERLNIPNPYFDNINAPPNKIIKTKHTHFEINTPLEKGLT